MGYKNDVFISYSRSEQWSKWVKNIFFPVFYAWLREELGKEPKIFYDDKVETGDSWPLKLSKELSQSRVMVALWTKFYFNSDWCKAELSHMYAREKKCGFRTPSRPEGLIIPASLHDGEDFPPKAKAIQQVKLHNVARLFVVDGSANKEELEQHIKGWVPTIKRAIKKVPPHDNEWSKMSSEKFVALFEQKVTEQETLPNLGEY